MRSSAPAVCSPVAACILPNAIKLIGPLLVGTADRRFLEHASPIGSGPLVAAFCSSGQSAGRMNRMPPHREFKNNVRYCTCLNGANDGQLGINIYVLHLLHLSASIRPSADTPVHYISFQFLTTHLCAPSSLPNF